MRKRATGFWRGFNRRAAGAVAAGLVAGLLCVGGCAAPGGGAKERLALAYGQLNGPTPDHAEMIAAADAYLAEEPQGKAAADAYYLRGRGLEQKGQRDAATSQKDFAEAHGYYTQALNHAPRPALEGLIRVGMGNVLYFQDRYAAALVELSAGVDKVERDWDKAWALYRIGLCNQRLGRWEEADKFFAAVQRDYASVADAAQRAREHQGARAFFVQVGAFAKPADADAVIADLKKLGVTSQRFVDPSGKGPQYVRVGPLTTYEQAVAARQRMGQRYAAAVILP